MVPLKSGFGFSDFFDMARVECAESFLDEDYRFAPVVSSARRHVWEIRRSVIAVSMMFDVKGQFPPV